MLTPPSGTDGTRALVRAWYDAESHRYRRDDAEAAEYVPWLDNLLGLLHREAGVLDLGCGCGIPAARFLVRPKYAVTGVDFSCAQLSRARRLVPEAALVLADIAEVQFRAGSFDAIVCLFALIHIPVRAHPVIIQRMHEWLRPDGLALVTVGSHPWTGIDPDWLGSGRQQYWSHGGRDDYVKWFEDAGFKLEEESFIAEGAGGHILLLARASTR